MHGHVNVEIISTDLRTQYYNLNFKNGHILSKQEDKLIYHQ
jgi:hypothetical protein